MISKVFLPFFCPILLITELCTKRCSGSPSPCECAGRRYVFAVPNDFYTSSIAKLVIEKQITYKSTFFTYRNTFFFVSCPYKNMGYVNNSNFYVIDLKKEPGRLTRVSYP